MKDSPIKLAKPTATGYLPFRGYQTYYKIFGRPTAGKSPLLVLHGGPGSAHNYLLGLSNLAARHGRQVVFYDQLGAGLSDHPDDETLWTIPLFIDQLTQLREHLNLTEVHLLGHSWGGMLAIEYLLTRPAGIHSTTLASTMISMPFYQNEVEKLKEDLPASVYATLLRHEAAGTTNSTAYANAYREYHQRHIYRGQTFPKEYENPAKSQPNQSYLRLWGASEAYANGTLKNWDRTDRLTEIPAPVLITAGQYDELTPHQALITHARIAGSEIRIFTAGSHCVHVERPAEYLAVLSKFLESADRR